MTGLDVDIKYLKGVGDLRAEMLKKEAGIFTLKDLLYYYPFRHVDRSKFQLVSELDEDMSYVQLKGTLESLQLLGQKRGKRLAAIFRDRSGTIELVWFQGYHWIAEKLQTGKEYIVF